MSEILRARKEALARVAGLEGLSHPALDGVTQIAKTVCDADVALLSFVDVDRQWFASRQGLDADQTPISQSICHHAVTANEYLEIPDTRSDERTRDNTLCTGDEGFRSYAGAIVRSPEGIPLGTVCVLDRDARALDARQATTLELLARHVETILFERVNAPASPGA